MIVTLTPHGGGANQARAAELNMVNNTNYYLGNDSGFSSATGIIGQPNLLRGSANDKIYSPHGVINLTGNVHSYDDLPSPFLITYDQGDRSSGLSSFNILWGSAQNTAQLSIGHQVVSYDAIMDGFAIAGLAGGSLAGSVSVYGKGKI